jgi:hypothetical protein
MSRVKRGNRTQEVVGSIPISSTTSNFVDNRKLRRRCSGASLHF